jgi:predicted nucleic acid-binding protein
MVSEYRIYFDVCCLNRPFDDWTQERICLEAEAVLNIINRSHSQDWRVIMSEAIAAELEKMTNIEKLENIWEILQMAKIFVSIDDEINHRSQELENLGFGLYDSFHIACAERAKADVLLTTDDRLLKNAIRSQNLLLVTLSNPVTWLMTIFQQEEGEIDNDTH